MSAKNRADLITKLHKFVKKEYRVVSPPSNRSVLEHMIYGCCLENSTFEAADEAFAKLQENYFDWNEVRVTTTAELAEACRSLSNPQDAATSLKKTLHGVFEHYYQFDLDFLRKENLSKAVQTFQKFNGVSPFIVSYTSQHGLGGHSIPIDKSTMSLFYVLEIVSENEADKDRVPGLERTIAKAKGTEFFVLVHQLSVAFASSPFNAAIREKLVKINPTAKERFPKRGGKKKEAPKTAAQAATKTTKTDAAKPKPSATPTRKATKKAAASAAQRAKPASKPAKKVTKKKPPQRTAKKKSTTNRLSKKKPR